MSQDEKVSLTGTRTNRNSIFAALTRQTDADVSGKGRSVMAMISAFAGRSPRTGQPDTAATAAKLGVSQRTVQRWLKAERDGHPIAPKPDTLKKLRTLSRRAATTKAGRRAALKRSRLPAGGVGVHVKGRQGPAYGDHHYIRRHDRTTHAILGPEEYQAMQDAYIEGGDAGLAQFLTGAWDTHYDAGWGFMSIDELRVDLGDD